MRRDLENIENSKFFNYRKIFPELEPPSSALIKKKNPKLAASFGIFVMSQPLAIYFWISSVLEVARHLGSQSDQYNLKLNDFCNHSFGTGGGRRNTHAANDSQSNQYPARLEL